MSTAILSLGLTVGTSPVQAQWFEDEGAWAAEDYQPGLYGGEYEDEGYGYYNDGYTDDDWFYDYYDAGAAEGYGGYEGEEEEEGFGGEGGFFGFGEDEAEYEYDD